MAQQTVTKETQDQIEQSYQLAPHEVDSLKEALGAHQQVLEATEDGYLSGEQGAAPVRAPGLQIKRRRLTQQAQQIKTVLDRCSPQPIPEKERDRYKKRADWLVEQFRQWLETRAEMHVMKRDSSHWQSAMEKARMRTMEKPQIEQYIAEWKYIMRRLEPGNPNADNLHKLRIEKHVGT